MFWWAVFPNKEKETLFQCKNWSTKECLKQHVIFISFQSPLFLDPFVFILSIKKKTSKKKIKTKQNKTKQKTEDVFKILSVSTLTEKKGKIQQHKKASIRTEKELLLNFLFKKNLEPDEEVKKSK